MMYSARVVVVGAMVMMAFCNVALGVDLINPTTLNGSFELLGGVSSAAKATHWDTDPDGNVDNWTLWASTSVNNNDSGTDVHVGTPTQGATDGTRVAFMQGNNAAYNLTSHAVQLGDAFTYTWDWVLPGRGPAIAQLAYEDVLGNIVAIPGTDSTNPTNAARLIGLGNVYTPLPGDPAIGRPIALTIRTPAGSNYPEVDNFVLRVAAVPEPATCVIALAGLFGLHMARRRS